MFSKGQAEKVFRGLNATAVENLSISQSFSLLVHFYETLRPDGALPAAEDGDMLLFEWGTYDWGKGPTFNVSLTRQIIYPDGEFDQEAWQLGFTYSYAPTDQHKALKSGNEFCRSISKAADFRDIIFRTNTFSFCLNETPVAVDLRWERQ